MVQKTKRNCILKLQQKHFKQTFIPLVFGFGTKPSTLTLVLLPPLDLSISMLYPSPPGLYYSLEQVFYFSLHYIYLIVSLCCLTVDQFVVEASLLTIMLRTTELNYLTVEMNPAGDFCVSPSDVVAVTVMAT